MSVRSAELTLNSSFGSTTVILSVHEHCNYNQCLPVTGPGLSSISPDKKIIRIK